MGSHFFLFFSYIAKDIIDSEEIISCSENRFFKTVPANLSLGRSVYKVRFFFFFFFSRTRVGEAATNPSCDSLRRLKKMASLMGF